MITFLYTLYVLVCLFLVLVVLLQAGRGGMGSAFGGAGSQTVFGGSGAGNFLTRLTVVSAALFMLLSATLTYVSSSGEKSLEKATEKIRTREEARHAASKQSAEAKKAPTTPAAQSTPEGAAPAAPAAPAEAAEPEAPAAPGINVGGTPIKLERVNPEDVPGLRKKATPITVTPAAPSAPTPAPTPAPTAP